MYRLEHTINKNNPEIPIVVIPPTGASIQKGNLWWRFLEDISIDTAKPVHIYTPDEYGYSMADVVRGLNAIGTLYRSNKGHYDIMTGGLLPLALWQSNMAPDIAPDKSVVLGPIPPSAGLKILDGALRAFFLGRDIEISKINIMGLIPEEFLYGVQDEEAEKIVADAEIIPQKFWTDCLGSIKPNIQNNTLIVKPATRFHNPQVSVGYARETRNGKGKVVEVVKGPMSPVPLYGSFLRDTYGLSYRESTEVGTLGKFQEMGVSSREFAVGQIVRWLNK